MQIKSFRSKALERFVKTGNPSGICINHAHRLRSIIKDIRTVRFPGQASFEPTDGKRSLVLPGFW